MNLYSKNKMSLLVRYPLWCSYCPLSTGCHSALHVPPPCVTFLQADVTLVPVNLAVLLRPIGNGSAVFCIPRRRFRDVSPLSQTLTEESLFPHFLSCTWAESIVFHIYLQYRMGWYLIPLIYPHFNIKLQTFSWTDIETEYRYILRNLYFFYCFLYRHLDLKSYAVENRQVD